MKEFTNLGKYLKERRLNKGWTQAELSKKLNLHSQFVSNWERGICAPPGASFQKLMTVLQINKQTMVKVMLKDSKATIQSRVYKDKRKKKSS